MNLIELNNMIIIEQLLALDENQIADINMNIRKVAKGTRIQPTSDNGGLKFSRAKLMRILKLADPATIEMLAMKFLADKGYKVTRSARSNNIEATTNKD